MKLWSPGVRTGVRPGSEYHTVEHFGPILGIMAADTLEQAIEYVNAVDYGLTSSIHSLDTGEVRTWLAGIHAGNLYVNRGITGAIVRRQPFGGWKKSAVGPRTKAGGPSYLFGLGKFSDATPTSKSEPSRPYAKELLRAAEDSGAAGVEWLRGALATDTDAWNQEFGINADPIHSIRVVGAALAAGATPVISTPRALPGSLVKVLDGAGITVRYDDEDGWAQYLANRAATDGPDASHRVRLVTGTNRKEDVARFYAATGGKPDIALYDHEVTSAGRVEMLPFLREQAVSLTAHRFGTSNKLAWEVI